MNDYTREILTKVKEDILREPLLFDILVFRMPLNSYEKALGDNRTRRYEQATARNVCGTVCCIAGYAIQHMDPHFPDLTPEERDSKYGQGSLLYHIRSKLEVPIELFHLIWWPKKYRDSYISNPDFQYRAEVAASLIDAMLRGEKLKWQ